MLEKTISSYQTKMNRLLEIESVREYCYYSSMEEQIETEMQESLELRRQIRQKHIDRLIEVDEVKEYRYYYDFCQGYEAQLDIIKRQIQLIENPKQEQSGPVLTKKKTPPK